MDEPLHIFVYGTLRRGGRADMHGLLARGAELVGAGTCAGRLFLVEDYPGVVGSEDVRDVVHGEVYRLAADPEARSALLRGLDRYEGYEPAVPDASLFVRVADDVTLDSGETVRAWVYHYNRPTIGLERIDSGDFFRR